MVVDKNGVFIVKAKKVHGDKYDYSKVEYIHSKKKVCIICPIHGEFWQILDVHLSGSGCKQCSNDDRTSDTSTFIEKAKTMHGDRYDYSKVEYIGALTKICIICPIHGEFYQEPSSHLSGKGCNKCGIKKRSFDTSTFISKATMVHGDKYDYSKVEYINGSGKVCIICPIHGEFLQVANTHLKGRGCKECGKITQSKKRSSNTSVFISKAKVVHGDKYDYSKVDYKNCSSNICIICPTHGEFQQTPYTHLKGGCCKKCMCIEKRTSDTHTFISKSKEVHGDKYDYSNVEYVNCGSKVNIICPIHGEFYQIPNSHLNGSGCNKCAIEDKTSDTSTFISKATMVHEDKYDYSKVEYISALLKVCIICPLHGEFYQEANSHLNGCGCNECGRITSSEKQSSDTYTFIKKAKDIHGDKYDYSKVDYVNNKLKVCIVCPLHGEFYQEASSHLSGSGCNKCSHIISKGETEIGDYIESLGLEVIRSDRKVLSGFELDLYIPSKNIAIEYNGLRWHSEEFGKDKNYHLNKTLQCKEKGVGLIHIFEDEYLEHKDIVLNKLKHILNVHEDCMRIMGRKCTIEVIDNKTAKSFLSTYHIQGYGSSTLHLGAVYGNELIAVMSFKKEEKECLRWELTRFASNSAYVCQGIGGKLFKHFIKTYNPIEVKSFADRRWTLNEKDNLYIKLDFELDSILTPEYRYVVRNERRHKFGFRKNTLHRKYGVPLSMTEMEMTAELGFSRIWDCGLFKYVWKRE